MRLFVKSKLRIENEHLIEAYRELLQEKKVIEDERDELEDENQELYATNYSIGQAVIDLDNLLIAYKRFGIPAVLIVGVLIGYFLR